MTNDILNEFFGYDETITTHKTFYHRSLFLDDKFFNGDIAHRMGPLLFFEKVSVGSITGYEIDYEFKHNDHYIGINSDNILRIINKDMIVLFITDTQLTSQYNITLFSHLYNKSKGKIIFFIKKSSTSITANKNIKKYNKRFINYDHRY